MFENENTATGPSTNVDHVLRSPQKVIGLPQQAWSFEQGRAPPGVTSVVHAGLNEASRRCRSNSDSTLPVAHRAELEGLGGSETRRERRMQGHP